MITMNKTGDMRSIADSAWISTMSEARAKSRSDEDVDRVVCFLAEHLHTSPFESVTLSFIEKDVDYISNLNEDMSKLLNNKYSKSSQSSESVSVTIDLLNFAKHSYRCSFKNDLWGVFKSEEPRLSEIIKMFDFGKKEEPPSDVTDFFLYEVDAEIISLHKGLSKEETRATWRVKCPLSVAVQILRHRTASFNMVSGRYKTIRQEVVSIPTDIFKMLEPIENSKDTNITYLIEGMIDNMENSKSHYLKMMKELKNCKTKGIIDNDQYKRMREYVRFILPEGRLTELYITMYLDDLDNFLMLRNSSHAQIEHIAVAQLMKKELVKYLN